MTLFRQSLLREQQRQWRGKALIPRGFPVWGIALLTLAFLSAVAALLHFGTLHRKALVSGELVAIPPPVRVTSAWQGTVVRTLVAQGQRVELGAPLYQLAVRRTTQSGDAGMRQRRALQQQIAALEASMKEIALSRDTAQTALSQQKALYRQASESSQQTLRDAERGLNEIDHTLQRYRRYWKSGLIAQDQLTAQATLHHQHRFNLLAIRGQHEQHRLQVMAMDNALIAQAVEFNNQIRQLFIQKNALLNQLAELDASESPTVVAPQAGIVDALNVTDGQTVRRGEGMLNIIPGAARDYRLVFWAPAYAVPWLTPGARVSVRYDAFPADKFGQFSGTIHTIAAAPATSEEMASWPAAQEKLSDATQSWFRVEVTPHFPQTRPGNQALTLRHGIRASGVLFLEKRRLVEWLFAPATRIRHDMTGPAND